MSRPLRIEFPGAWYHVMNRGRRGEEIFSGSKDFKAFIELLQESAELWAVKISAYCLMSNHYHLLLQTPQGNLSRYMRHLNGVYTQRYNRVHNCDGTLFRGRYKAILVEEDPYLLELVRYIHRNPLRAGIIEKLDQYQWSSHPGYLSRSPRWDWLHKDFILSMFASPLKNRIELYRDFVAQPDGEDIRDVFEKKKWPGIIGRIEFIDWAKNNFFTEKIHKQIPDSAQLAPDIEVIKGAVCSYYGVGEESLMHSVRGMVNEPRNVAIYLTRTLCRKDLLQISAAYGMRGYSSASSVLERINKRLDEDQALRKCISEIKEHIIYSKSQTET